MRTTAFYSGKSLPGHRLSALAKCKYGLVYMYFNDGGYTGTPCPTVAALENILPWPKQAIVIKPCMLANARALDRLAFVESILKTIDKSAGAIVIDHYDAVLNYDYDDLTHWCVKYELEEMAKRFAMPFIILIRYTL